MAKRARAVVRPELAYQAEIMARALEVLGRKWALLVLRDIAFLKLDRFGEILRNNPGLTPRVLSRRLQDLAAEGVIVRTGAAGAPTYKATAKGEDALFILFAALRYGLRHYARGEGGEKVGGARCSDRRGTTRRQGTPPGLRSHGRPASSGNPHRPSTQFR